MPIKLRKKTKTTKNKNANPSRSARSAPAVKPKGSIPRSLLVGGGSLLGTIAGGALGMPGGGIIGGRLGEGLSDLIGFGDYAVKSNSLVQGNVPTMHGGMTNVRIKHREYIRDVVTGAAGAFTDVVQSINPGFSTMFPWLSNIARCYQQYRIHGMVFYFKSNSADALNSTNTALGSISMVSRYNSNDVSPFINKTELLNEEFAISGKPSSDVLHPIECKLGEVVSPVLTVRSDDTTGDARLYDHAVFHIITAGMQGAAVNIGELWCTYDIEFFKPSTKASEEVNEDGVMILRTGASNGYPFGTATSVGSNALGVDFGTGVNSGKMIGFPLGLLGVYRIHTFWEGTAQIITQPNLTYTNCVSVALQGTMGLGYMNPTGGSVGKFTYVTYVRLFDSGTHASVLYSGAVLPSSATVQVYVDKVDEDLVLL